MTAIGTSVPDLFDPTNLVDPYPAYAELRAVGPVYDEANRCWLVARHADVLAVLHQPHVFSSQGGYRSLMGGDIGPDDRRGRGSAVGFDQAIGARVLIASDPPTHTDLRRLVSRPFTRRAIESWGPRVAALADELVGAFVAKAADGPVDLVDELAVPLPVTVIAEILGIPVERRQDFRRWSDALVGSLSAEVDLDGARSDVAEMVTFFMEVAEQRRRDPGDDLISAIAGPDDDGSRLEPFEVVMFCVLLLVAGNETTTNLLGNLVEALWDHPDQAQLLIDDPGTVRAAVEEGLRYCGPIQGLARRTTAPAVVGDVEIPGDDDVLILFAAANRDGAVFDDAERFDLGRDTRDQVALGHGIHYCLGAHLARTETAEALRALRDRGVRLEPAGAAERTGSAILRGFSSLPVSVTVAPS